MKEHIRVIYSPEQISKRVQELAGTINRDLKGEPVTAVIILKGSVLFAAELVKELEGDVRLEFMKVSSYGSGTESSGNVRIQQDLSSSIEGKNVLIIEDIVDSGNTLHFLREYLEQKGPKQVRICTLLDKPDRRTVDVPVEYVGFVIPDRFVVGFGLDYDEKYRTLPYVGELIFDK